MDWCALFRTALARFSTTLDMNRSPKPISRKSTKCNNVLQEQCPGESLLLDMENQSDTTVLAVLAGVLFYLPHTVPGVTLSPLADQELHNKSGDTNPTQGCREVPRAVEEHWLTWFLVLMVCSKKGVCNNRCHKKCSVLLACCGDNDPATDTPYLVSGQNSAQLWIKLLEVPVKTESLSACLSW